MRRKISVTIIIIVCFLLQSTLFKALSFASISPNLLVVVTAAFGFMRGKKEGMIIGLFCGLLMDIFFGSILGFYSLEYMYIGYFNGFFRKQFFPDDIKLPLILIGISDILYNLGVYVLRFFFRGNFHLGYFMLHIIIPELVYTLLITIVLYFIILKINQHLELREKRSAKKFV